MTHIKVTGRLENWFLERGTDKEFIIWGEVFEDVNRRFPQGKFIHTSGIKHRRCSEGDIVETRNSTYLLGKPKENNIGS